MPMKNLSLSDDLFDRLKALLPRLRIRLKRGGARDANMSELMTALLEAGVTGIKDDLGATFIDETWSFPGAVQVDAKGKVIARAPLASASVYVELMESPGVPTPVQQKALNDDAALIEEGTDVFVRGNVFHSGEDLVGAEGVVITPQRGRGGVEVLFDVLEAKTRVSPYDLIPAEKYSEHVAAVAVQKGGKQ